MLVSGAITVRSPSFLPLHSTPLLTPFLSQYVLYVLYNLWHIDPRRKLPEYTHEVCVPTSPSKEEGGLIGCVQKQVRLEIGVFASMIIPISLFIFGWSAHYETHWMGPTFGAALYFPAIFLLFQSVLCYIVSYSLIFFLRP